MENLREISLHPDEDWYFTTMCAKCKEQNPNKVHFKLSDLLEMQGSRGLATYIYKCKFCECVSSLEYLKNSWSAYTEKDNEKWKTIAAFDCRGMELVHFFQGTDWTAEASLSDQTFGFRNGKDAIEFDGPDWCGFDEDAEEAVGIYEFKYQFVRSK